MVGSVVGYVIARRISDAQPPATEIMAFDFEQLLGPLLAIVGCTVAGAGAGFGVGSLFRTEVWTELPPGEVRPRP